MRCHNVRKWRRRDRIAEGKSKFPATHDLWAKWAEMGNLLLLIFPRRHYFSIFHWRYSALLFSISQNIQISNARLNCLVRRKLAGQWSWSSVSRRWVAATRLVDIYYHVEMLDQKISHFVCWSIGYSRWLSRVDK